MINRTYFILNDKNIEFYRRLWENSFDSDKSVEVSFGMTLTCTKLPGLMFSYNRTLTRYYKKFQDYSYMSFRRVDNFPCGGMETDDGEIYLKKCMMQIDVFCKENNFNYELLTKPYMRVNRLVGLRVDQTVIATDYIAKIDLSNMKSIDDFTYFTSCYYKSLWDESFYNKVKDMPLLELCAKHMKNIGATDCKDEFVVFFDKVAMGWYVPADGFWDGRYGIIENFSKNGLKPLQSINQCLSVAVAIAENAKKYLYPSSSYLYLVTVKDTCVSVRFRAKKIAPETKDW